VTGLPDYTILWMRKQGFLPTEERVPPAPYHGKERYVFDPVEVKKRKKWLEGIKKKWREQVAARIGTGEKMSANQRCKLFNTMLKKAWKDGARGPDEPEPTLTAVEQAIQIYLRDPNQSDRQIAKSVGCSHSVLSRSQDFQRLKGAYQGKPIKGSKSKEGFVE